MLEGHLSDSLTLNKPANSNVDYLSHLILTSFKHLTTPIIIIHITILSLNQNMVLQYQTHIKNNPNISRNFLESHNSIIHLSTSIYNRNH